MVLRFNQEWWRLFPVIFKKDIFREGTLPNLHLMLGKKFVLLGILAKLVDKDFGNLRTEYCEPDIKVSRRKAMMFTDDGKVDNAGTSSIFGQITT